MPMPLSHSASTRNVHERKSSSFSRTVARRRCQSVRPMAEISESLDMIRGEVELARIGPAVSTITEGEAGCEHDVERMDTIANAQASVIVEGIQAVPLENSPSAQMLDGYKKLLHVSTQRSHRNLGQLSPLQTDTAGAAIDKAESVLNAETPDPQQVAPSISNNNSSHSDVESTVSKTSIKQKKNQIFRNPAHAVAVPSLDAQGNVSSLTAEHVQRFNRSGSVSRAPSRSGSVSSKAASRRRRSSVTASIAESIQSLARSASKLLEKNDQESINERRQAKVAELMEKDVMVLNEDNLAEMQQRNAIRLTISVHSTFRHWWDFFITLSIAYVIVTTPVKVGFEIDGSGFSGKVDVAVDVIYLIEILLNFFTSYIDDATGEEVKKLSKIRHNYIYGFFWMDALSSFPSSLIGSSNELLTMMKILKVTRVGKISQTGLFRTVTSRINRSMNPSLLRMFVLTFIFLISQHFIACTYNYISIHQHQFTSWQPDIATRESSLFTQYVHALHFAILVTTANDVNPTTTTEKLCTSVMLFVGIVINASIIGSAANLLSNLDKTEIARKNQMDSINEYMRFKKVPLRLQNKIRRFYEYAFNGRIIDQTETMFCDLPDRLKLALRITLQDQFIQKVPLFRVCSKEGVIAIVQCLRAVVVMSKEVIIAQDEIANDFYLIRSGRVSLCVRTSVQHVPLGNLGEGSFFGEYSLLTGEPHQAEVKSEVITELAYLTKDDFTAIIDKFPTFYLAVRRISDNRMQTAQNVQRMTKMQRHSNAHAFNSTSRKLSVKNATEVFIHASRLNRSLKTISRHASLSNPFRATMRLSQRFSGSRRVSSVDSGPFSPIFVETMSLSQARHLAQIRAMENLEIENVGEDPEWG